MDIQIIVNGSITLFQPTSEAGRDWLEDNLATDAQWIGGSVACDHRYADTIAIGAASDGLVVDA